MNKISSFVSTHFSTLLIGLVFSLGCECCCDCKDEQVSTLTISMAFFPTYTNRTCPIPVPAGALTGVGGNIIPSLTSADPFLSPGMYYLWVEFESCCDNFKNSPEFVALSTAGTAYYYDPLGSKRVKYIFALNTTAGSTMPTIPIPTSSSGSSIEGSITIKYYEPCMNLSTSCESIYPCFSSSTTYRPYYESLSTVPWSSNNSGHDDVTTVGFMMHLRTECNSPQGWLCGN